MWNFVIALVVSYIVSYALAPKPQNAKPAGLGGIDTPTAEEGRVIGVLFGSLELKAVNTCWYGDLRTVAVKKKGGKK